MFQIETISAKMLDYYVDRSDAVTATAAAPACRLPGAWQDRAVVPGP